MHAEGHSVCRSGRYVAQPQILGSLPVIGLLRLAQGQDAIQDLLKQPVPANLYSMQ